MMQHKNPAKPRRLPRVCLVLYALAVISAGIYFAFTQSAGFRTGSIPISACGGADCSPISRS